MAQVRSLITAFSAIKPGQNLTADEQLFPSKVRCRFTQYMVNKPDKYGIKFWMLVDNDAKYLLMPSHTWEKMNYVLLMKHYQRVL
jgi:hypothetical protein